MSMSPRTEELGPARSAYPKLRLRVLLLLSAVFSGCAVGPNFHSPAAPQVSRYSAQSGPGTTPEAQGTAQRFVVGAEVAAQWWELFRSPALDAMVREALAGNPGLDAARANLRASEDNLRSGYGIFYPSLEAGASATRERLNPKSFGEAIPGSLFNVFSLSATVSYALDVFGGQRRLVEELHAQVDVAQANARATYLALAANVIDTAVAEAAYRAEIDALEGLIELQKDQVAIAAVQAQAGTVPYSNVLSLKSQLATSEASIPALEQKLEQSEDLLAALTGHVPAEWHAPPLDLQDLRLPRDLPVSLPADLVRQRPDVLAAEATGHAASANVGIATAALLPSFSLTGTLGSTANSTHGLLAPGNGAWNGGATLSAPLFEGGTLWYKRRAAVDNYNAAMALYRQTVLAAFEQVADSLHALDSDAAALSAQDEALSTSAQALHLIQANYQAGIATYLDVLNADTQYRQAKIADIQALAVRYQDTVALFAALGGGWWNAGPSGGE